MKKILLGAVMITLLTSSADVNALLRSSRDVNDATYELALGQNYLPKLSDATGNVNTLIQMFTNFANSDQYKDAIKTSTVLKTNVTSIQKQLKVLLNLFQKFHAKTASKTVDGLAKKTITALTTINTNLSALKDDQTLIDNNKRFWDIWGEEIKEEITEFVENLKVLGTSSNLSDGSASTLLASDTNNNVKKKATQIVTDATLISGDMKQLYAGVGSIYRTVTGLDVPVATYPNSIAEIQASRNSGVSVTTTPVATAPVATAPAAAPVATRGRRR